MGHLPGVPQETSGGVESGVTDQVIYSMVRVGRMYPPNKWVLRDI